jgi:hypothetical protein
MMHRNLSVRRAGLPVLALALGLAWPMHEAAAADRVVPATAGREWPIDLEGVWAPLIHEDATLRGPGPAKGDYAGLPINAEARRVADAWDPGEQLDDENQCRSHTAVYMMRSPFKFEIIHSDNMLVLTSESFEQVRTVYLDGREHHPKESPKTRMGDSIGWWEGDTLVVETTNMERGYIERNGVPHSEDAVLTEYFTRQSGSFGDLLTIVQVVEDPQYLSQALVRSISFRRVPEGKLEPYPCTVLDL